MSDQQRVKPAGKNLVRNPDAAMRHLDPAGETVVMSTYWRRLIKSGEIEKVPEGKTNADSI